MPLPKKHLIWRKHYIKQFRRTHRSALRADTRHGQAEQPVRLVAVADIATAAATAFADPERFHGVELETGKRPYAMGTRAGETAELSRGRRSREHRRSLGDDKAPHLSGCRGLGRLCAHAAWAAEHRSGPG